MLWVLKGKSPKKQAKNDGLEHIYNSTLKTFVYLNLRLSKIGLLQHDLLLQDVFIILALTVFLY